MEMFAVCRNGMLAGVLCAALSAAQAQEAKTQAEAGAVADGVSSFVGVAVGAPVNPVVPVLGLAFKAATFRHAESLPETERPRAYAFAAARALIDRDVWSPPTVRKTGRVISRRPVAVLPSSSETVSTCAQSSPAVGGGSIAARPCSQASAW